MVRAALEIARVGGHLPRAEHRVEQRELAPRGALLSGGMAFGHVADLVADHAGQLVLVVGQRQQAARHEDVSTRQRERVRLDLVDDAEVVLELAGSEWRAAACRRCPARRRRARDRRAGRSGPRRPSAPRARRRGRRRPSPGGPCDPRARRAPARPRAPRATSAASRLRLMAAAPARRRLRATWPSAAPARRSARACSDSSSPG